MPHPFSSKSHAGVWLLFAIVLAGLDQAVKYAVQIFLPLRASIEITPFFNWVHVLNPGAAFSLLADAGGWQRALFIGVGTAVSAVLTLALWRGVRADWEADDRRDRVLRRRMREMVGPSPGAGHPAAPDTSAPRPNAPR